MCREAEQLVAERTSAMVANHSHRTYAWGAALATLDGLSYDREVVYVAALLHDLYADAPDVLPYPHCCTLPEVDKAQELGRWAGWDEQCARTAAEAITLHANLWPPRDSRRSFTGVTPCRARSSSHSGQRRRLPSREAGLAPAAMGHHAVSRTAPAR